MTTEFFQNYLSVVVAKYNLHTTNEPERNDWKKYADGLISEIDEIHTEVKEYNAVYLEDELGDVLWDFMNMCYILQQERKVDSIDSIFQRSLKKYGQRINAINIDGHIDLKKSHRDAIKQQQKQENLEEHTKRYGFIAL